MYIPCIYQKAIILSLFKVDTLNFTMYNLSILTCLSTSFDYNLISMNIFFIEKSLFFFIIVKRQPKENKLLK